MDVTSTETYEVLSERWQTGRAIVGEDGEGNIIVNELAAMYARLNQIREANLTFSRSAVGRVSNYFIRKGRDCCVSYFCILAAFLVVFLILPRPWAISSSVPSEVEAEECPVEAPAYDRNNTLANSFSDASDAPPEKSLFTSLFLVSPDFYVVMSLVIYGFKYGEKLLRDNTFAYLDHWLKKVLAFLLLTAFLWSTEQLCCWGGYSKAYKYGVASFFYQFVTNT